jgi:hypothetical protein
VFVVLLMKKRIIKVVTNREIQNEVVNKAEQQSDKFEELE